MVAEANANGTVTGENYEKKYQATDSTCQICMIVFNPVSEM